MKLTKEQKLRNEITRLKRRIAGLCYILDCAAAFLEEPWSSDTKISAVNKAGKDRAELLRVHARFNRHHFEGVHRPTERAGKEE